MKRLFLALLTGTVLQSVAPAMADEAKPLFDFADKERWIIRARAISVSPDVSSTISGLNDTVDADEAYTAELDFTYFFTDNVAAELILATTNHDMGTDNGINLGHKWVLPPTLTLQYHFNPEGQWRPYAGAGLGYIIYYGEDSGAVDSVDNGSV
ncbi:MAG: hypothetical protein MK137_07380 [Rickettsiales bacterium]|nr:hypothetical protein [Rickettsiales bacterium]